VAVAAVQEGNSQSEILRHLLEGAARFAGRVALFVVKGGAVNGWQGIGFDDNDAIRNVSLESSGGLAAQAVEGRMVAAGPVAEFDPGFENLVRTPAQNNCMVLPLVVRDKVAALIYADGGLTTSGSMDASAMTALTRFAALWLEVCALRKSGAAAPLVEEPQTSYAAATNVATAAASSVPASFPAGVPVSSPGFSPDGDESDQHKKARRFAKLLVEEIKLYNQLKVAEGRQNRDLYDRLREEIEKSRATYEKRYGDSPVSSADFFNQELVRILADSDVTLMGVSFPQ
jgi:hypothetical protein